jgi:hypothetical protein
MHFSSTSLLGHISPCLPPPLSPSHRGFHVCYIREGELAVPLSVSLATGNINCMRESVHRFRISFEAAGVRDEARSLEMAARMAEITYSTGGMAERDIHISHSVVPGQQQEEEEEEEEGGNGEEARGRNLAEFTGS